MNSSKNVPVERHTWTNAERQYIQGIVHNYSLQRWTDQDIVNFLWEEKKIKIARSTVTKIKNQVEQQAEKWYIELRESGSKYVAVYKERLDSLLSYQKKLHDIISVSEKPEVQVRAISELHSIEMSLHSLFKELPQFDIVPDKTRELERCTCAASGHDIIRDCKCRTCLTVWCPTALNQDWCPNPECSGGIKGCQFQPYDEHFVWIKCTTCERWFKTQEILDAHNCYIKVNPKAIEGDLLPGIGGDGAGPIVEQPESLPHNEQTILTTIDASSSPIKIEEQTEIEEEEPELEESEQDKYWRLHPARVKPNHNNNNIKYKQVRF
jgi:hypothetical protein